MLDMAHKQWAYEARMLEAIRKEKEENQRKVVAALAERFSKIDNFEELKGKAIIYLQEVASGKRKIPETLLIPYTEIELSLSRDLTEEEKKDG
jgi:DNA-binding protein H-NS